MPKKLTQEEFEDRVKTQIGDKYTVISQYQGKNKPVTLHCNIHNYDFSANAECFMRKNDIRCKCPKCQEEERKEKKEQNYTTLQCAYCGKEFKRLISKLENSKSGLYFCCRQHKDLAQRLESGEKFDLMRPEHFGNYTDGATAVKSYRKTAFNYYPHKCAICGWDEDEDILQVHHIDENRQNCFKENLIILCPTCHWKLTLHKYKLINREQIVLC